MRVLELRKGSVQLVVNALPPDVVPLFRADPRFTRADRERRQLRLPRPQPRPIRCSAISACAAPSPWRSTASSWCARSGAASASSPRRSCRPATGRGTTTSPPTPFDPAAARAPARRGRLSRPRRRRPAAAPAPHLQDLDRRDRRPPGADPPVDVARDRRRRRDPLLRVRDLLRRHQARQLPALQPHLDGDRRPRHLHARSCTRSACRRPAPTAGATRNPRFDALVEQGARLADRAARRPLYLEAQADRGARPALPLAVHQGQRRRAPRRPRRAIATTRAASSTACVRCPGRGTR